MKIDDIQIGKRYWFRQKFGDLITGCVLGKSESQAICMIHRAGIFARDPDSIICEVSEELCAKPKPWWKFWAA